MKPCGSYFHSSFKGRYFRYRSSDPYSTVKKSAHILCAYYDVPAKSIRGYFNHCGIIGDESPKQSIQRLLAEGLHYVPLKTDLHTRQVCSFRKFCKRSGIRPHDLWGKERSFIVSSGTHFGQEDWFLTEMINKIWSENSLESSDSPAS